jgi:hypothetical protein
MAGRDGLLEQAEVRGRTGTGHDRAVWTAEADRRTAAAAEERRLAAEVESGTSGLLH